MIASGTMHSVAGWPQRMKALADSQASSDAVAGLAVPWHDAGMDAIAAYKIVLVW